MKAHVAIIAALLTGLSYAEETPSHPATKTYAVPQQGLHRSLRTGLRGDVVLVPVQIGNKQLSFMLDTGSAMSVLDSSIAAGMRELSPSKKLQRPGFPSKFTVPDTVIDCIGFQGPLDVAVVDLTPSHAMSGHQIHGVLGADVLHNCVIHFDFDRGVIDFGDAISIEKGTELMLSRDEFDRPFANVDVGKGRTAKFLISTGMAVPGLGEINEATFSELLSKEKLTLIDNVARVMSVSGVLAVRKGQLASLRVGPFEHQQIGARESDMNALGLDYLSRFSVTLDCPKNRLYLSPGKRFNAPTAFDMSGIAVVRLDGKTIAAMVTPGTPAAVSGIQEGDCIVAIDNVDLMKVSLLDVRRRLATPSPGATRLTLDRAGDRKVCELTLKNWQGIDMSGQRAGVQTDFGDHNSE